jgi:CBS domain containing-hemolysin-like protein
MVSSLILVLLVVFCVVIGGLFSGAETGMYQLSRLRLRLGIEKRQLSFLMLGRSLRDSSSLLLSMLVGTNIAQYIATSIVTLLLLKQLQVEHTAQVFAAVLTAPLLFVFSELIPKNIFFYRADSLMPCFAPFLFVSHKLFVWSGLVPLFKNLSRLFARLAGLPLSSEVATTTVRQPYIKAIVQDITEEAFLSTVQTDIITRLVSISHLTIKSVMTPLNKVQMVDMNSDKPSLFGKLKNSAFTRLPVYEHRPSNVVGFINIYEALTSSTQFNDLHDFVKPIHKLQASTIVSDALNIVRSEKHEIILVTRTPRVGRERPIGIVTMKDLVEELLGELAEW